MAVNLIKWMILINLRSHKATFLISTCDSDQRYCIHLDLAVDVGIKVQIGWPDSFLNPNRISFIDRDGRGKRASFQAALISTFCFRD